MYGIWVHTSDILVQTSDIQMTYEWHTNDMYIDINGMRIVYKYIKMA